MSGEADGSMAEKSIEFARSTPETLIRRFGFFDAGLPILLIPEKITKISLRFRKMTVIYPRVTSG
jgi:hypothetical protein